MKKILILYMPVIHRGYFELFGRVRPNEIALLSNEVLGNLPDGFSYILRKDAIRAISPEDMKHFLGSRPIVGCDRISIADEKFLVELLSEGNQELIMPDEDVSHAVAQRYFLDVNIVQGPLLRYHRDNSKDKRPVNPDRKVDISNLDRNMITMAVRASQRSPDWYRQVGAVLVSADEQNIISAYNMHEPHEQVASALGDPRSLFKAGDGIEISHADHAEHVVIGEAAKRGLSTRGASLYVTTFPCPGCARLVARSGIKRVFFREPYSLLDAETTFRAKKVELIEVRDE